MPPCVQEPCKPCKRPERYSHSSRSPPAPPPITQGLILVLGCEVMLMRLHQMALIDIVVLFCVVYHNGVAQSYTSKLRSFPSRSTADVECQVCGLPDDRCICMYPGYKKSPSLGQRDSARVCWRPVPSLLGMYGDHSVLRATGHASFDPCTCKLARLGPGQMCPSSIHTSEQTQFARLAESHIASARSMLHKAIP